MRVRVRFDSSHEARVQTAHRQTQPQKRPSLACAARMPTSSLRIRALPSGGTQCNQACRTFVVADAHGRARCPEHRTRAPGGAGVSTGQGTFIQRACTTAAPVGRRELVGACVRLAGPRGTYHVDVGCLLLGWLQHSATPRQFAIKQSSSAHWPWPGGADSLARSLSEACTLSASLSEAK